MNEDDPDTEATPGPVKTALAATGQGLLRGGAFVARKAADAYHAVDPDVRRHMAHLPLMSYSLFAGRRQPIEAGTPDGHPPLVFAHGLGGNGGEFLPLAWHLALAGRKRRYRIRFEPEQSVAEMAEALTAFVREVLRVTGEERIEFVAHSLGGVVARLAIQEHGLAPAVRTLITLGSPHGGTYSARYAGTPKLRELRPDSELVARLNGEPWPDDVRGIALWSRNDVMILPAESAAHAPFETAEVTPFTHYSYLLDPRAWQLTRRALAGERLPAQPFA